MCACQLLDGVKRTALFTNSVRRISRHRPFLSLPGEVRPDWWIIAQVAQRMGFAKSFGFGSPAEVFAEHVALTAYENDGTRDLDLSGLTGADYATFRPVNGRCETDLWRGSFGDGAFFTHDGRPASFRYCHRRPFHTGTGPLHTQHRSGA